MDEGALCLSSCRYDPLASETTYESRGNEDRHKAPSLPRIRPLSLQNRGPLVSDLVITIRQICGNRLIVLLAEAVDDLLGAAEGFAAHVVVGPEALFAAIDQASVAQDAQVM